MVAYAVQEVRVNDEDHRACRLPKLANPAPGSTVGEWRPPLRSPLTVLGLDIGLHTSEVSCIFVSWRNAYSFTRQQRKYTFYRTTLDNSRSFRVVLDQPPSPYHSVSHRCLPIDTRRLKSCSLRPTRVKCIVCPSTVSAPAASASCCSTSLNRSVMPSPSTSAPDAHPSAIRDIETCD